MQPNSNPMKDGGETIKQVYSSLLKNNFVPQQFYYYLLIILNLIINLLLVYILFLFDLIWSSSLFFFFSQASSFYIILGSTILLNLELAYVSIYCLCIWEFIGLFSASLIVRPIFHTNGRRICLKKFVNLEVVAVNY